jgi:hypothetical protein
MKKVTKTQRKPVYEKPMVICLDICDSATGGQTAQPCVPGTSAYSCITNGQSAYDCSTTGQGAYGCGAGTSADVG